MIELIIGQAWPYLIAIITAAGAILGSFLLGRSKGKDAERLRHHQASFEANARAGEKVREVDQKHMSMSTSERRDRARERLQASGKADTVR